MVPFLTCSGLNFILYESILHSESQQQRCWPKELQVSHGFYVSVSDGYDDQSQL